MRQANGLDAEALQRGDRLTVERLKDARRSPVGLEDASLAAARIDSTRASWQCRRMECLMMVLSQLRLKWSLSRCVRQIARMSCTAIPRPARRPAVARGPKPMSTSMASGPAHDGAVTG